MLKRWETIPATGMWYLEFSVWNLDWKFSFKKILEIF